ncbi:hypothetical protein GOB98_10505 [Sinorhizobium meliloti]|nr:hypothetical protein [Sinorhizobium meliloti]MDW9976520.1 hypothetical protein [Sinorhizobium meliloti]MDX0293243.1 hypothetical protein [Sinorhizobium meliloti]
MKPTMERAAIIKVRGVIEIAAKDSNWAQNLRADPRKAIQNAGLDLAPEEVAAVEDIILGTTNSSYATPPTDQEDKYPELRKLWHDINSP